MFLFLYFILPWIHFYNSSLTTSTPCSTATVEPEPVKPGNDDRFDADATSQLVPSVQAKNPRKDKTKPKHKFKAVDRIRFYFTAPVTKFYFNMVGIKLFENYYSVTKLATLTFKTLNSVELYLY